MPNQNCRPEDAMCMYLCLSSDIKIEEGPGPLTLYVMLIIENIFRVSL